MFDRAKIIENNFITFLSNREGLSPTKKIDFNSTLYSPTKIVSLFESQLLSRILDIKARTLRAQGKSFYTIGSSGHEGMAVVGEVSRLTDMAFLHYRDCALMIQRSKKNPGHTIINDLLLSFCASSLEPISGGRHKVLGSKELFIPPQTSTIASHLPKAVGMAFSIQRAKRLGVHAEVPDDSVVVCTFGDASLNHASSQTAINCAEWISYQNLPLPIVFICEDNGIGISVSTPSDWVKNSRQHSTTLKYFECDGLDLIDSLKVVDEAFNYSRTHSRPSFIRFKTVRLMGHAGSDIETVYLGLKKMEENERRDPLLRSAETIISHQLMTHDEVLKMYQDLKQQVDRVGDGVILKPALTDPKIITAPVNPSIKLKSLPQNPDDVTRAKIFGAEWEALKQKHPLAKLINMGLTDQLLRFKNAVLFGEDVAKKGGVYNVTANLETRFGKNKVFNSLLDETTILGTAIGLAHNNILPIPEIQFLAYFHNAEDQLRGEAATLSFFSNNQYTNGMVIRIAGLGYQKGFGGHFHNDNSLNIFRDIPGLLVACPSNGKDAVLMMRTCLEEAHVYGRVCVFIEPIALYPVRDLHETGDNLWAFEYPKNLDEKILPGDFFLELNDKEICLLSYGNGFYMSKQAQKILKDQHGINPSLIDLRWIAPLSDEKLAQALSTFKHVLIVEECRKTGSLSEALMTLVLEKCHPLPKTKRISSMDCFIPLADAANLVLVQTKDIVTSALELLSGKKV